MVLAIQQCIDVLHMWFGEIHIQNWLQIFHFQNHFKKIAILGMLKFDQ